MFQLHDNTRRWICLTGFFLFCILPALGGAVWCVFRNLPWADDEAIILGRQLGMDVRLAGLKNIRPGVVRYEGFEIADPETGKSLLRCRRLEVQRKTITDGQGNVRPVIVLLPLQGEIEAAGIHKLGRLLERVMQGQTGRPAVDSRRGRRIDSTLRRYATNHYRPGGKF